MSLATFPGRTCGGCGRSSRWCICHAALPCDEPAPPADTLTADLAASLRAVGIDPERTTTP